MENFPHAGGRLFGELEQSLRPIDIPGSIVNYEVFGIAFTKSLCIGFGIIVAVGMRDETSFASLKIEMSEFRAQIYQCTQNFRSDRNPGNTLAYSFLFTFRTLSYGRLKDFLRLRRT